MSSVRRFSALRAATLAGAAVLVAGPLSATPGEITRDDLNALEKERAVLTSQLQALEEAETTVARDLGTLEADLISAAMESRRREEQATAAELELLSLRTRLSSAREDLISGENALEGVIASLAVSGRHRPPALVTSPGDANTAIRAAILMGHAAPRLQVKTAALSDEIDTLRRLEAGVQREQARLQTAEAGLALKREEITRMAAAKRAAFEDVSGDAEALRDRVTLLAREADTIRGLLAAIEAAAPAAPALKPRLQYASVPDRRTDVPRRQATTPLTATPLGALARPASGDIVRAWGDTMPGGTKSEGLTIATRSQAQISAPVAGKIEFAGPFRTYGELLIISTSDDYHVLLSGMANSYVTVGQSVSRGEPIAKMGTRVSPPPELYMELRKAGKPVNPAKWMNRG